MSSSTAFSSAASMDACEAAPDVLASVWAASGPDPTSRPADEPGRPASRARHPAHCGQPSTVFRRRVEGAVWKAGALILRRAVAEGCRGDQWRLAGPHDARRPALAAGTRPRAHGFPWSLSGARARVRIAAPGPWMGGIVAGAAPKERAFTVGVPDGHPFELAGGARAEAPRRSRVSPS